MEHRMRLVKVTAERCRDWQIGRHMLAMSVVAIAAVGAAIGAQAQGMDDVGGMGDHGPGPRGGMSMFGGVSGQMGRGIDRMLDGLGVTDAQRAQIKQITTSAATDIRSQREAGRALHEKGMQLFAAPTVDASAAESLRQQMLAQHDQSSKRMLQAMLDVSKVLTPEQRVKMAQRAKERQDVMRERMQREQRERGMRPRQP
jgi:Spy/CpxP family protein refolding chaperone